MHPRNTSLLGFPFHMDLWIKIWLWFAKVTLLVNDIQGQGICCKWGLRQGDPYLYWSLCWWKKASTI